jgi:hypothetical protein
VDAVTAAKSNTPEAGAEAAPQNVATAAEAAAEAAAVATRAAEAIRAAEIVMTGAAARAVTLAEAAAQAGATTAAVAAPTTITVAAIDAAPGLKHQPKAARTAAAVTLGQAAPQPPPRQNRGDGPLETDRTGVRTEAPAR